MSQTRAVSTVVDVSFALVLVSAAVVTVVMATPPPQREENGARTAVALLATTTANVSHPSESSANRVARGTVATLLADAVWLRRRERATRSHPFVRAVHTETNRTLRHVDANVQVVAFGTVSGSGGTGGRVVVGAEPPPCVAVDAASFVVPAQRSARSSTASTDEQLGAVRIVVRVWSA